MQTIKKIAYTASFTNMKLLQMFCLNFNLYVCKNIVCFWNITCSRDNSLIFDQWIGVTHVCSALLRTRNSFGVPARKIVFRGTLSSVARKMMFRGRRSSVSRRMMFRARIFILRVGVQLEYPARKMLLRGASSSVWVFPWSTRRGRLCSAEHSLPCGCSVGVPGAEDNVPRNIVFRVGVPSEFLARKTMFRGTSSSVWVFRWSSGRGTC